MEGPELAMLQQDNLVSSMIPFETIVTTAFFHVQNKNQILSNKQSLGGACAWQVLPVIWEHDDGGSIKVVKHTLSLG